jgi:uncharacterized protein (DUF1015 family)
MPAFRPFKGILPEAKHAQEAILASNQQWNEQLSSIVSGENPNAFQNILAAANPALSERESALACERSEALFREFLQRGIYTEDTEPGYYLYFTRYKGIEQTGIIGLCNAQDLIDKKIKKHEHTRNDRVDQLYTFLKKTQLFSTPVFLTYHPVRSIEELIHQIKKDKPVFHVHSDVATDHTIWRINKASDIALIKNTFEEMPAFYIADGHHRAAISERYAADHPNQSSAMLSILIASNNLTIFPFYRRILNDQGPVSIWELLDGLKQHYNLRPCSIDQMYYQYLPAQQFILSTADAHWQLIPKNLHVRGDVLTDLDVSILQTEIIGPYLNITDPKSDPRIAFGPMSLSLAAFKELLGRPETAMIFICRAPLAEVIFKVADEDKIMPPKSTSFEPKIVSGLVLHSI